MPTLEWSPGRKLAWREEGSGPALVLVHGSPADGRAWNRVVPFLKQRHRLIMPDLPGYGASEPVPDDPRGRAALMGTALACLIDSVGPVALAGHSYGGLIALEATLQLKEGTVTRLTMFEPMFMCGLKLAKDPIIGPVQEFFDAYVGKVDASEPDAVGLMIDYWFGKGAFTRLPDPVKGYLNTNAPKNVLDVRSSFAAAMTASQLGALKMPVLMVWGDRSPEVIPAMGRALQKLVPGARVESIAGGNHGMLDFHPEAVARFIAE